ncbi:MAG: zincin-like metallopeptidase domain-containing protein [Synechococcaceae cyanobacterium]
MAPSLPTAPSIPTAPATSSAPAPSSGRLPPEERLVASLITLLEAGTTPWRRPWDASAGGHHVHLLSGRAYRGSNPVLLTLGMHLRGSSLPWWCGFAEARSRGLHPRRGSKAVHVLQPVPLPRPQDPLPPADPDAPNTPNPARPVRFRPVAVFNAADLEGPALPELIAIRRAAAGRGSRSEPERLAAAEEALRAWPVPVCHGGERAYYQPGSDRIHLPERAAFHSSAALYATWAHEAIHSTGHPSRLARNLSGSLDGGEAERRAYAREELVAELGAVLLGDRLEIGSEVGHHAAYLSHWVAMLQESPQLLLQVLGDARRAVDQIVPE